jgi:hypothetical protein
VLLVTRVTERTDRSSLFNGASLTLQLGARLIVTVSSITLSAQPDLSAEPNRPKE